MTYRCSYLSYFFSDEQQTIFPFKQSWIFFQALPEKYVPLNGIGYKGKK